MIMASAAAASASISCPRVSVIALALGWVSVPSASRAPMPGSRACSSHASYAALSADWVEQASAPASS